MVSSRWLIVFTALAVGAGTLMAASPWAGGAAAIPFPTSMAAAGDSVSQAFGVSWSHFLSDSPADSWATGSNLGVDSHYQRILAANPMIAGRAYNYAKTGAKMADLDNQVKAAAGDGVQYLTILIGANDLCASSPASMTPTATFRAEFRQALSDFFSADRHARVFVASIPNLFQLWSTLHRNRAAELTWRVGHICPSLLSRSERSADRQAIVAQEKADNAALAAVCRQYPRCRWDGYTVYRLRFTPNDVSRADHFHPSRAGQRALAASTWAAGFWPTAP